MRTLAVAVLLLVLPVAASAGTFYKCIINGGVVYQADPCPGAGGAVDMKPILPMGGARPAAAGKSAAGKTTTKPQPAAAATAAAGTGYTSDKWHNGAPGYRQAMAESKRTGAPVFVYFFADWCGYCKRVDQQVLPDPKVAAKLRNFIKVRINAEKFPEDKQLFDSLGGRGYPFLLSGRSEAGLSRLNFGNYQPAHALSALSRALSAP